MNFFDIIANLPAEAKDAVIVIGNFDGVHKGHQEIIKRARAAADGMNKPLGVLTFEPHPRKLFRPDEPPSRITPFELKKERLARAGIDHLFCLPFDWNFASQTADEFIQNILIDGLNAAHIIVGYDFKFGQLRKGTPQTIKDAGLPVSVIEEIKTDEAEKFSSSQIRQRLRHGKIEQANALLGWDWEIQGDIFKGDQRGRELGYPTANMELGTCLHPAYGIYACHAQIKGEDQWHKAACNIGIRPMFEVETAQVETFIFDFDRDIYGQTLRVRPVKRLRGEAKFESLDELIKQMEKDCTTAREVLG